MIDAEILERHNRQREAAHRRDLEYLAERLARSGIALEAVLDELAAFEVALPTWAMAAGGTRFGRFPVPGEPRTVFEKLEDAAVIHQLTRATPRVSPHFPWDVVDDWAALRAHAEALGLGFDAVNSNTFQDQPGQPIPTNWARSVTPIRPSGARPSRTTCRSSPGDRSWVRRH